MPNHHFLILYTTLQGKKYILTLAYSYFLTKQETSKNVKSEAVSSSYNLWQQMQEENLTPATLWDNLYNISSISSNIQIFFKFL
jgi:hypothetical protein